MDGMEYFRHNFFKALKFVHEDGPVLRNSNAVEELERNMK